MKDSTKQRIIEQVEKTPLNLLSVTEIDQYRVLKKEEREKVKKQMEKKYKVINKITGTEHICIKVNREGVDYYVTDEKYKEDELLYCLGNGYVHKARVEHMVEQSHPKNQWRKIIAISSDIDNDSPLPEIINKAKEQFFKSKVPLNEYKGFMIGYKSSQESHPYSKEDIFNLIEWMQTPEYLLDVNSRTKTTEELFKYWEEQRVEVVYCK